MKLFIKGVKGKVTKMRECSVTKKMEIGRGGIEDYKQLACYHYRSSVLGPYRAIFSLRLAGVRRAAGVIVYSMPTPGLELRNIALGGVFGGLGKIERLALINKNIRCINRVIIEPRFRGLGLASRLVRETMGRMQVPVIETLAVMGHINPFFEKAGMTAYRGGISARCVQMIEAFSVVGIEEKDMLDAKKVESRIEKLSDAERDFIELQMQCFLAGYGKRRLMEPSVARMRLILSKLTLRPIYYVWFNPEGGINADKGSKSCQSNQVDSIRAAAAAR
jgi:hypothetical protein